MELTTFIEQLLGTGSVVVQGNPTVIEAADRATALLLLEQYYNDDIAEMPAGMPPFHPEAAAWAAEYLLRAVQLTVLRNAGETAIAQWLNDFEGEITAAVIYSADLSLRHLPDLFHLAKGLAPADALVQVLLRTAAQWPLSTIGIDASISTLSDAIDTHPALRSSYASRIIEHKNQQRANHPQVQTYIHEAAGTHINMLWPGFQTLEKN
jgi:hypothetical protein